MNEVEEIKEEASTLRKSLSEKEAKLKSILRQQEAREEEIKGDFQLLEEELLRLRRDKTESAKQIEEFRLEVQTLKDAVKVRPPMTSLDADWQT